MTGTTLSQYRILEELGRGGMGIVYKAEDTKLERQVALKVLPAAALASEDDRARFYREAKAAAALNHPNIAAIHQIDEAIAEDADGNQVEASDGPRPFIAMEFIEGGTLEDRIKAGPLKLDEAVRIATQVADALKAAHAKDIVHRDIKSANIMLTTDGQAKVLDFGLAQTNASTKLTRMGSTLGTVAYMSPEQARGEEVDGRTDLYSLGTVLYEMIAGKLPFGGEYEQAVVYSILNADPEPLTALRTGVPMELERITNKLLAKDADRRYQGTADLIADLAGVDVSSSSQTTIRTSTIAPAQAQGGQSRRRIWTGVAALGVILIVAAYWIGSTRTELPPPPQTLRIMLSTGHIQVINRPAISNNARYVTFQGYDSTTAQTGFFLLDLEQGTTRYLEGSEGGFFPFFSPNNQRLAVTDGRGSSVLSLPDGELSRFTDYGVAGWYSDLELFTSGPTAPVISLDGQPTGLEFMPDSTQGHLSFSWPTRVRGTDRVLMTLRKGADFEFDLVVYDLQKDEYSIVSGGGGGFAPIWTSSGHMIERKGDTRTVAHVRPFDPNSGEYVGPDYNLGFTLDLVMMGLSDSGHLVRSLGRASYMENMSFVWYDLNTGELDTLGVRSGIYSEAALSSDGDRVAVLRSNEGFTKTDLVSIDLESSLQSDFGPSSSFRGPFWPDASDEFFFVSEENGVSSLHGSMSAGKVAEGIRGLDGFQVTDEQIRSVSNDMSHVLTSSSPSVGKVEILVYSVEENDMVHSSTHDSVAPAVSMSPDGRHYALVTDAANGYRLVVVQVDGTAIHEVAESKYRIYNVLWSDDGSEILYKTALVEANSWGLFRIDVGFAPSIRFSTPELVGELSRNARIHDFDGRRNRILLNLPEAQEEPQRYYKLEMILNFSEELKRLAPHPQ